MWPLIRANDQLIIAPVSNRELCYGDVVLFRMQERLFVHRIVRKQEERSPAASAETSLTTKGDACRHSDPPIAASQLLGQLVAIERRGHRIHLHSRPRRLQARLLLLLSGSGVWWYFLLRIAYYSLNWRELWARLRRPSSSA